MRGLARDGQKIAVLRPVNTYAITETAVVSRQCTKIDGKVESSETALGSDVMNAALEGYALLKVSGKGQGLEALRQSISARFAHRARAVPAASPPNA